ncbi:MAG: hypothetical protein EOO65_03310 [Methanosarcinales archaeon]|nr:MAG: hypothetical protein EOO65_03310 [Methanosarcinales archaeon]
MYTYRVQSVSDAEFKYEQILPEPGSGAVNRTILDRHGLRILVKQAGNVGRIDVPTFLIAVTSSLGLLAVAATLVNCFAFNLSKLRFVYRQYKAIESFNFDEVNLTDEDLQRFKGKDLINPRPTFLAGMDTDTFDAEAIANRARANAGAYLAARAVANTDMGARQPNLAAAPYGLSAPTANNPLYASPADSVTVPLLSPQGPVTTVTVLPEHAQPINSDAPTARSSFVHPPGISSGMHDRRPSNMSNSRPLPPGRPPAAR